MFEKKNNGRVTFYVKMQVIDLCLYLTYYSSTCVYCTCCFFFVSADQLPGFSINGILGANGFTLAVDGFLYMGLICSFPLKA